MIEFNSFICGDCMDYLPPLTLEWSENGRLDKDI